ncbi:MAG: ATP-binding protein, partial [Bacillota bacterium]
NNLENIVIPDVEQLPAEAVSLKETLQAQEIKSAILVPITGREELIGFWGIDAVAEKKVWHNNISNLLKIIGEIFGNALQQNKYEAKLKRNQERLELSLWGANIGLWDWDVNVDQVQFNSQWARMFGYSNDNLERDLSAWKDMIHPEDKEETINKFEEHLAGETDYFESEHRMETKEGNWKWVLGRGRVVSRDKNNDPLRVVGVHVDITNKKELDNIKSDLISTVSHEIRTPLSSVLGFTELLLERDLSAEKQRKYLEMIHRESNRLKNLINDFLDIQRIESGNHQLNLEEIDLEQLITEVISLYEVHDSHQFIISLPDEELNIRADYNKLKQVVTNLVSNAVKYSPGGSKIKVIVEEKGDSVRVTVEDDGIGIAKADQKNLFTKFYRTKSSTVNQIEGTGLGLAICKKIIEAHQGEIGVESELERGSSFYFTIPNN